MYMLCNVLKMKFWINLSLLRFWNSSKKRSAHVIGSRYMNTAVSQIGSVMVRKHLGTIQEKFCSSISGFRCVNNLKCHPKGILKQNLFMKHLMELMTKKVTETKLEEEWGGPEAFKLITFIKDNFEDVIKNNSSVLVFFSASWCPHCLRLRKPYGMAALMSKEANLPIMFATFDVNHNPDLADEKGVVGIPLIKYYKNEKFVTNYKGKRTAEDLFSFAKNPPEPLKEVKQPDI